MADLKENFKKWLIQQGTKSGTITSYLSRLQKISHKDWDNLTSNIIPFLVKYYELANKEYYLDCITILQALKYFNTISDNIYKNTNITNESDIKLYLFDGKKDYFICDTDLKSLYDDVWLINRYLYESNDTLESKHTHNIDLAKLSILMLKVKENYRKDLKRIIPSFNGNETALTQETETKTIGNIKDFDLPECLKNLSLKDIFEKCNLSDDELEKLKESHANDNLPPMPTDPTQI